MARSEIRDPIAQVARLMQPDMRAVAQQAVATAAYGGDTALEVSVTRAGVDEDGNAITKQGFTIGLSAIGGPDGIG